MLPGAVVDWTHGARAPEPAVDGAAPPASAVRARRARVLPVLAAAVAAGCSTAPVHDARQVAGIVERRVTCSYEYPTGSRVPRRVCLSADERALRTLAATELLTAFPER
jgi:hypothetical protein